MVYTFYLCNYKFLYLLQTYQVPKNTMDNPNTSKNSKKRSSSSNLSNISSIPQQNSSSSNNKIRSIQSTPFQASANIPQSVLVDSAPAKRRVSLTELLNCKFVFHVIALTIPPYCSSLLLLICTYLFTR